MDPQKLEQFRQAAVSQGYTPKEVDAFLKVRMESAAKQKLVEGGQLGFEDYAKTSPVEAQRLIEKGFKPQAAAAAAPTAAQQQTTDKKTTVLKEVEVLENFLNKAEARGPIAGRASIFPSGLTKGAVNPNVYQFQEKRNTLPLPTQPIHLVPHNRTT